ncbi:SAP domain-containing protein [Erysipelotrichaceae bacterium HCN-30851]
MEKDYKGITSYNEFIKYYWYREELIQICRALGISHTGTKQELLAVIKQYYDGEIIRDKEESINMKEIEVITLNSKLLECGFSFNQKFRQYFSEITNIRPFKFNADMAETWRMVKKRNDHDFTIKDMLDVYYGKRVYARYDHSICEWNQFVKDFCADPQSKMFSNKLKTAAILWKEVRTSTREKKYHEDLVNEYFDKIKDNKIDFGR